MRPYWLIKIGQWLIHRIGYRIGELLFEDFHEFGPVIDLGKIKDKGQFSIIQQRGSTAFTYREGTFFFDVMNLSGRHLTTDRTVALMPDRNGIGMGPDFTNAFWMLAMIRPNTYYSRMEIGHDLGIFGSGSSREAAPFSGLIGFPGSARPVPSIRSSGGITPSRKLSTATCSMIR